MYEKPTFTHMTEKGGVEFNTFRKINIFKGNLAVTKKYTIFAGNSHIIYNITHEDEGLLDAGDDYRPVSGHWAGVYT